MRTLLIWWNLSMSFSNLYFKILFLFLHRYIQSSYCFYILNNNQNKYHQMRIMFKLTQHLGVIGFLGSQTICHQVFKFVARFLFMSNVNRIFFQNCLLHTRSFYCVYQSWEVFALALPPHHWLCQGVRGYIGIDSNHFKMASQKHKLLIGIKYSLKVP